MEDYTEPYLVFDANVEPVSAEEHRQVTRVLAGGRCDQCGRLEMHVHAAPADG